MWMNLLHQAADPAEPRQAIDLPRAIDVAEVTKSAKEFDALQLVDAVRKEGSEVHVDLDADEEIEVVLRVTACGLATLDGACLTSNNLRRILNAENGAWI